MKQDHLTIFIEAIKDQGEDSQIFVSESAVTIGVFDGLGGKSAGFGGEKGGRIASREASKLTGAILQQNSAVITEETVRLIQHTVCHQLKKDADEKIQSRIKGSLNQRLCTTLAVASIDNQKILEHSFTVNLAWIGDSRIYFLCPEKGLQQLTQDDLKVKNDAFKLISEDSPMSQYLTADIPTDWQINFKQEKFQSKGFVIACTDGCFQCLTTPWFFERLLLETLTNSDTVEEWQNLLSQEYEKIKQDDVSLLLYPVGLHFNEFTNIKNTYKKRLDQLTNDYNCILSNYEDGIKLWNKYRINYEERLNYQNTKFEKQPVIRCPKCESENFIKKGHTTKGKQRYRCRSCNRNFLDTYSKI